MPQGEISIRLNCSAVPCASFGFSATGKRISFPLSITIIIWPSRNTAERALSAKILMPLLFGIGPTYGGPNGKAIAFGNIDLVEPDFFALNAVWFHRWFAS